MRRNTKQFLITELLNGGNSRQATYEILRPMVEAQQRPMIFSANVGGRRQPKSLTEQLRDLGYAINRIANSLDRYSDDSDFDFGGTSEPAISPDVSDDSDISDDSDSTDEPDETDKPERKVRKSQNVRLTFLEEIRRIRKFCEDRSASGETIDSISNRPLKAASRLLEKGIPANALLAAMVLHWPEHVRREALIPDFDFVALSKGIMAEREIEKIERSDGSIEQPHEMFGYVLTLLEARQPVLAIGEAGTGKSFLAEQIADYMNVEYSEAPMTPGASRGDLLGRHTMSGTFRITPDGDGGFVAEGNGYIPAECVERYSGGGLMNFEELDAADPGMVIVLNNAMESKQMYNTVSGERHEKHSDFMAYATANTFGLGANRQYTGRERLDFATLDRWRMGRVILKVDPLVEESILGLR
jgi:hypothetical protein